jgi:hypothetical protein
LGQEVKDMFVRQSCEKALGKTMHRSEKLLRIVLTFGYNEASEGFPRLVSDSMRARPPKYNPDERRAAEMF